MARIPQETPPDDPEALLAMLQSWRPEALTTLQQGIARLLSSHSTPLAAGGTVPAGALPHIPGVTLRHERVQCGKPGCTRCPHGPYWYAYWREGARLRKRYLGKDLPSDLASLRRPA